MTTLTGKQIIARNIVTDLIDASKQEQPCGVDLTVSKIESYRNHGVIDFDNSKRSLPPMRNVNKFSDYWHLEPGSYLVTFNETVDVPADCMGLARPRSSLLRMGATMETSVWDPGYKGKSQCMLVVHNQQGLNVYQNAKLIQIIFMKLDKTVESLYSGAYQNEGL